MTSQSPQWTALLLREGVGVKVSPILLHSPCKLIAYLLRYLPATTASFLIALLTIMIASCNDLSVSSVNCSAPPWRGRVGPIWLHSPCKLITYLPRYLPATTASFLIALLTIIIASCNDLSVSSMNCSAPPRRMMVQVLAWGHPVNKLYLCQVNKT